MYTVLLASSNEEGSSSASSDSEKSGDSEDEDGEEEEEEEEQMETEEITAVSHIQDHHDEALGHNEIMEVLSPVTTAASTSPVPPPSNLPSTSHVPVCCVCIEKAYVHSKEIIMTMFPVPSRSKHNDIVTCDMCGLSVHEGDHTVLTSISLSVSSRLLWCT